MENGFPKTNSKERRRMEKKWEQYKKTEIYRAEWEGATTGLRTRRYAAVCVIIAIILPLFL